MKLPLSPPRRARHVLGRVAFHACVLALAGCAEGVSEDDPAGGAASVDGGGPAPIARGGSGGAPGSGGGSGGGDGSPGSSSGGGSDGGAGSSPYDIDLAHTSVSGFSSGGFFAVQFHLAFSAITSGAAIFAGGPFYCAQGSVSTALGACASAASAPNVAPLVAATKQMASSGLIDDPGHLAGQRVFLYGGAEDTTVSPAVMDSLNEYYGAFLSPAAIQYESRHAGATHTFPTLAFGNSCAISMSPWVSDCAYDAAGKALAQIYGPLAPAATTPGGAVISLPQGRFVSSPASHSLGGVPN